MSPIRVKILQALKAAGSIGLTSANIAILLGPYADNPQKAAQNALFRMKNDQQITCNDGVYHLPAVLVKTATAPKKTPKPTKKTKSISAIRAKKEGETRTPPFKYTFGFSKDQHKLITKKAKEAGYATVEAWMVNQILVAANKPSRQF